MFNKNTFTKRVSFFLFISLFFYSCGHEDETDRILFNAERLMRSHPDSSLLLIQSIEHPEHLDKGQYAEYLLLKIQALSLCNLDIRNDTLMHIPIAYFKKKKEYAKVAIAYMYKADVIRLKFGHDIWTERQTIVDNYLLAIEYAEKVNDYRTLGIVGSNLASLYIFFSAYEEALSMRKQAKAYLKMAGDTKNEVYLNAAIGEIYQLMKMPDSAIYHLKQSVPEALARKDSYFLTQIYQIIAETYCYEPLEMPDSALRYAFLARENLNDANNVELEWVATESAYVLAQSYILKEQPDSAILYIEQVDNSEQFSGQYGSIYQKKNINYLWSGVYEVEKKYDQALDAYKAYLMYNDSLDFLKKDNTVVEIQHKYELLHAENRYQKIRLQRFTLIIVAIAALLFVVMAGYFIMLKMKSRKIELLQTRASLLSLNQTIEKSRQLHEQLSLSLKEKEERLKSLLMEKLGIAQQIAQFHIVPNENDKAFMQRYQKIFGKSLVKELEWDNLNAIINELFDGFADKVKAKYPVLSVKDLQLCCFIRSGFKADEVAVLLNYTQSSVRVVKSRLCKKMGFENAEDFYAYLMGL